MKDQSNRPLISIIMPNYNRGDCIEHSINGILNQTFQNFELIIIDDGSTDNSVERIKSFKSEKIKLFTQENKGVSAARNLGIQNASGNWISFCDSDDVYLPTRLETFLELDIDEDCLIYSGWIVFEKDKNKTIIRRILYGFEKEFDINIYQFKNLFLTSAVMIKKNCLDKVGGFDESLTFEEDWDLFLRIADQYPIHQIKVPTFLYQAGYLEDPRKKHHLPDNRKISRTNIAKKRITQLLSLYKQNKDSEIAKKIYLMSFNLDNNQERRDFLNQLDSFVAIADIHNLMATDFAKACEKLKANKNDKLINYLFNNLDWYFNVHENIFAKEKLTILSDIINSFKR